MYVDSHCHLDFPDLAANLDDILIRMKRNQVERALVVSVTLDDWPRLMALVEQHDHLHASVGVHPGYEGVEQPSIDDLLERASHPKVIAIGETGLDYHYQSEPLDWQRDRFRTHIQASRQSGLPVIIHTRKAVDDTLRIMREEDAASAGGVMHCFTESLEMAEVAMEMGFYISISGIVTFKNAKEVQEVAAKIPLERLLIETDSPYLAPIPYRGKTNDPSYVIHVAEKIAELRQISVAEVAEATKNNFYNLFNKLGV
ncbi:TatD family hydrolase [Paenalcaligenes niemegkensis]|uniref:TatD family hydrolase n=1 Tax=Paenalcaligenes niemegkensis TaxID=2895469 RepID=UPI001EE8D779|nr:TatD family hydrolase [Paenalcaligenes niemegkensis]MCQ9616307.1 TatD family hydrolase [Paenalcaligenes niemegkensis]